MIPTPTRQEIDHRTIKLIVGIIAISLPFLTALLAANRITSISDSYYEVGWSHSFFTGFLFAIAAFMCAYNGVSRVEMVLSKIASLAGLGIALFPCRCGDHPELIPGVHAASAAVMFLILAYFCDAFLRRARQKGHVQATIRVVIYAACGIAILAAIGALALDHVLHDALSKGVDRFTFYGEATGLIAFGISWLTASRVLPGLTRPDERFSPLRQVNPP